MVGGAVRALRARGLSVGGVLCPGELREGRRWSFDLGELETGRSTPMATRDPASPWPRLGGFAVNPEALERGRQALSPSAADRCDLLVVDEVGPWELAGEGWAPALARLRGTPARLLLVVRRSLLAGVQDRYEAEDAPVLEISEHDPASLAHELGQRLDRPP
jgi:nucleoside-triphosphatase THEP1